MIAAAPLEAIRVVTDEYRQAVIAYRIAQPTHGPIRIAQALPAEVPQAHRGTISRIRQQEKLSQPCWSKRDTWQIPVGRHRVQMEVQQLPAIEGGEGEEYKISLIHWQTRMKYWDNSPRMHQ